MEIELKFQEYILDVQIKTLTFSNNLIQYRARKIKDMQPFLSEFNKLRNDLNTLDKKITKLLKE